MGFRILAQLLLLSIVALPLLARPRTTMQTALIRNVLLPNKSPLITFRLLFMSGSAYDPQGKEGVATLTAAMLAQGGTRQLSYDQIVNEMYPLATSFDWQVDKEMTVFTGTTHLDNLDKYYSLISQMLLEPGFREDDFKRLRTDAVNYLKVTLRGGNDEELGKEVLYRMIYNDAHPYGHQNRGDVSSLEALTVNDVREFYRTNFTQAKLVIGLAGSYPSSFPAKMGSDFHKLPPGRPMTAGFPQAELDPGIKIQIIQRETRSTAMSLGFPLAINRSHKDWPALALVTSYFGEHRSSNSHLYQRLREARGLNYGDYAYIEYFPRGMFQFVPDPNLGRQQQIFQIWIRPVEPQNGLFTLRAALYEYEKLVREGLSKEAFEATRTFLMKYVNVLTKTQDAQLGYALDSDYYRISTFTSHMREALASLTLEDVNAAIRKYLKSDSMRIAIVTKDAPGLKAALLSDQPSPIKYNSPKPPEVLEEDKVIQVYKLKLKPSDVVVVPVDQVFQ